LNQFSTYLLSFLTSLIFANAGFAKDSLFRAAPNPFYESTEFFLPTFDGDVVSLNVYDRFGKSVGNFFKGAKLYGSFQIPFDADSLADGLYFAALNVNGEQKAISLVKQSPTIVRSNGLNSGSSIFVDQQSMSLKVKLASPVKSVEVYSLNGQVLMRFESNESLNYDISTLEKGIYIVRVQSGGPELVRKFFLR